MDPQERTMKAAFTPGTTFANYRVESLIGRGGMGLVYLATDLSLDRPVALKLIAPECAEDDRFRSRFLREPRLAASLDHPNVIPIYEAGEHDGQLYLAMRYAEGSDLKSVLAEEGRLSPERALAILAQVAGALDAAHRRALVHRDVKPANVLIDPDGHVYLTDFGITKQLGGDSTATDQVVGTLGYLAPEQIRGDPVDGRADGYALGCVLYECLTGAPPFRRDTEAATLWAHMQEEPAPLRGHSALDPVLRKALAKDRENRYESCSELIDSAARALNLSVPRAGPARLEPSALRRRGRLLLVGGGLLLLAVAAAVAGIATLGGGEGKAEPPARNGIAAIDAEGTQLASFTETDTPPSGVAVGEGAVWLLSLEDRTISRIDPETKQVVKRFRTTETPTDVAAGAGAVWVRADKQLDRLDPDTGKVESSLELLEGPYPGDLPAQNWDFAWLAVGAGAVWVINEDRTVSRIDAATGKHVATLDVDAATIAAGSEGVWFISGDDSRAITRIDPSNNRLGQTIRVGAQHLSALAVGGGHVWASAEGDGLVWRIDPGRDPVTRTIDVGVGVTFLAYGAGAVWAANYNAGTVSRIDPDSSPPEVESTPVGAVQWLAAGLGAAWVSTAGATSPDGLPESCGELQSGAGEPDVLIASDLPLQGGQGAAARGTADAIQLVMKQHDFRAGRFTVGYRSCDDSTEQTGLFDRRACAANAHAYAKAKQLVALIGTYNSDCAQIEVPILNRAPGGAVAMISPSNTYPGLTRPGLPAPWGYRGEPDVFYPTGERNYVRLPPLDDQHGTAHAILAKQLGLRSVYVVYDSSVFWEGLLADPFRYAARRLGIRIAGVSTFDEEAKSYDGLMDNIARSGAQGLVLGGDPATGADRVLNAIRDRFGSRLTIMGGFLFLPAADEFDVTPAAVHGMYVATSDVPRSQLDETPAARRFLDDFGPDVAGAYVLEAAQATELVLGAIARSDGTRASVLEQLRASRVENGILGSFRFDRNGDLTPAQVPIARITGSTSPDSSPLEDAVVDRVVEIPRRLIR
jgi:ABC-type branched-subunit amino acid transport system substrate-binding protein/streptogramin lyase